MKKPSQYLRIRQRRLAIDRYRRRSRHVKGKNRGHKKQRKHGKYRLFKDKIIAPKSFDLMRGSSLDVCNFLTSVADAVLRRGKDVTLDFRATEMFYPEGAIVMYAEIDRIVAQSGRPKPITLIDPIRRRPKEVMKQIGIHELTSDRCDVVPSRDDVIYWKATKGRDQSGDRIQLIEVVADRVKSEFSGTLELGVLWRGVSEAVANSVDHAYRVQRSDGFTGLEGTKWWMFTQVREGILSVAVCDLGCGYRRTIDLTIPEIVLTELASLFVGSNKDAKAIQIAMQYGRSGTWETQRGKGSRDAMSVLERHGSGELFVLSNSGYVGYSKERGRDYKVRHGSIGASIRGTVVWWRLPISGAI